MKKADIVYVEHIECQTLSPWSTQSIENELERDRGVALIAEYIANNGAPEIVGWCAASYIAFEAELLKISVHREFRQNGIGKGLLRRLISVLAQNGVGELFLEVRSENYTALKFYANSGFLKIGERKKYYSNPEDSALILQYTFKP